jgi:hypothetical protein
MAYLRLASGVVSGLCLATVAIAAPTLASPDYSRNAQISVTNNLDPVKTVAVRPGQQVICSRVNPLAGKVDGDTLAKTGVPDNLELAANVLDIFCRDVRINTIVVRHYCTVVQK